MNVLTQHDERRRAGRSRRNWLLATLMLTLLALTVLAVGSVGAAGTDRPFPTPLFISPVNGETVSGLVIVQVYAPYQTDCIARLGLDGGGWQEMNVGRNGIFLAKWQTAQVANGKHTLTALFQPDEKVFPVPVCSSAVSILVSVYNDMPDG